jgi:alanine racemase
MQRALARVNLAAIERNVARLSREVGAGVSVCAVVKGDGYGHGAVQSARAALAGGARWLAVATASEAVELRDAGIGVRILVMGALTRGELELALSARADVVAWTEEFVDTLLASGSEGVRVHVKLDSGMGRLGTRDLRDALVVAERVATSAPRLELAGAMTHFATADGDQEFVTFQLSRFAPFVDRLREAYPGLIVHAANSAGTLGRPEAHFDLVRCGIAVYGGDPMNEDPDLRGLEPALELSSYVAAVKRAAPGDSAGYGRTFIAERSTCIGTLPIGYADGVRRALSNNCEVLVDGDRYPLVGTVSMDNVTVDLGPETDVQVGARAVLIGSDGGERVSAEEMARRIGTINYEVLCGISGRVPRAYHHDGVALP